MWLSRDERRLLQAYYLKIRESKIGKIDKQKWYKIDDLVRILPAVTVKDAAKELKGYFENDSKTSHSESACDVETSKREIKEYLAYQVRVSFANSAFVKRELISLQEHQHEHDVVGISLTVRGYDLGMKYNSWWTRSSLWFEEYKNHWIWLIVSFLGGVIGALLVNWLSKGD